MEFKEEKPAQCFDERRESDSNRRVAVLQTAVLTTSPPRPACMDFSIASRLGQIQSNSH